ncbi:ABC transporter ATP-binding protein/permease [Selenomonadales bacterium OttesenSCG-928-I06]|nr:ABC transporter ATP-binding protein/permease [Selenomonadales bacterium OttesenSCG-928-I06]
MNLYLRLLEYVKPYWPRLVVAIICIIFASSAHLILPWIIKDVIDEVLNNKDVFMLNVISIGVLVVMFFRGIFFYGQTYLMSYIGQRIIIDIRESVYRQLQRLSLSYFERKKTGVVMSYVTNDVAAVQGALIESVIEITTETTVLIGSIVAMFLIHAKLSVLTLVTVPIIAVAINLFGNKLRRASTNIQERAADITAILQESISAVRIIKSFVRETYEIGRFNAENFRNFRAQMKAAQISAVLTPVIEFLATIGVTVIIWYGGMEVIDGNLTSGALIAFLMYAVNLSNPIKRLGKAYTGIQRALAAAERVFDVIDTEPEVKEKEDAKTLPQVKGLVEFKNVKFSYKEGEKILEEVSFVAQPGQMIALVGSSGAGKTTIVNLIPRFYNVTSGEITIDGYNIADVTLDSLREQISIVPQETVLFNGSIYDNILYGKLDATKEEIVNAAKAANAHDFITEMPEGYETMIGERGSQISGGQRQRIAIARAILKDPRILILDEATSALDNKSEKIVQEALDKLMVGRTSFVIAHRLSTIVNADIILVMEKGRIVERGTHQELLENSTHYKNLSAEKMKEEVSGE